jgi:uncharacterized protein
MNQVTLSTPTNERIVSIDILRGFAVLGILIMNIQSFSLISQAYMNPFAHGELEGLEKWVWIISHVIASEKFMSIFSMLFGAGVLLFYERILAKGGKAGKRHYIRNFWLLIFGLIHGYGLWHGDILVSYSLTAFFIYLFRKKKVKTLIIWSAVFLMIPIALSILTGISIQYWDAATLQESKAGWTPTEEMITKEISQLTGGFASQWEFRSVITTTMITFIFFYSIFWRVASMMLLGMVLYKTGVLSNLKSKTFYLRMTLIGIIPGWIISSFGVYQNFNHGFEFEYSMFLGSQYNFIASVFTALGYIGLINYLIKLNFCSGFFNRLQATGKMAFTNYILMTLICTTIFYGHGFGLFESVDVMWRLTIVVVIWAFILLISPIWLKRFRMGPLEWLWRSLTYLKKQ